MDKMLLFVKKILEEEKGIRSINPNHSFRNRFEHTKRVLMWIDRIISDCPNANVTVIKVAAIFHDVGYSGIGYKNNHPQKSVAYFEKYLKDNPMPLNIVEKIKYCILNHTFKDMMYNGACEELIILQEADLLDEEGALGIAFDLMDAGAQRPANYHAGLREIKKHSGHIMEQDYMVTPLAKKYWNEKRELVKKFIEMYENDLN